MPACSGWTKPIASSTRSACSSRSVPATGPNGGAACACAMCCPLTRPSAPEKWVVTTEKSCSPRPMSFASSIA